MTEFEGIDLSGIENIPEGRGPYDPIPNGEYPAYIEEAIAKPTKAGDGQILAITWGVTGEAYQGAKVFQNINIANPSQKAQEIGWREFRDLCLATIGHLAESCEDLLGREAMIKINISQQKGYDPRNNVKKVSPMPNIKPASGQPQSGNQHNPQQAYTPPPPASPPWRQGQ